MMAIKKPGLSITEEPGGRLRKQLVDYNGEVVLNESILPHDDLIAFMQRPLREYREKLKELEKHPLFKESLDVSAVDHEDFMDQCFDLAYSFEKDYPEAYFFMRIALEDILTAKDDGSASFLLRSGKAMLRAVSSLYNARVQMRNIMEICFGTTEGMTQQERWERVISIYPQLGWHTFASYWEHDGDVWVQRYEMRALTEFYFFELCTALRTDKRIARCKHCWRYFVPRTKKKTDYCDRVWKDGRTCKQHGPNLKRKDGPAEDKYLLAAKILHARFYERHDKFYSGDIPYNGYEDWAEKACYARIAYLEGEIDGEELMLRINPDGEELNLELPEQTTTEEPPISWEALVEGNIKFDPNRHFVTLQTIDLGEADPQWKLLTAEEQKRLAKRGNISLREKYRSKR